MTEIKLSAVEHSTTRTRKWSSWNGTREDLARLGRIATDLHDTRKVTIRAELKQRLAGVERPGYVESKLSEFDQDSRVHAMLTHGADTAIGPPGEVLSELDRRTVSRYEISAGYHYHAPDYLKIKLIWPGGSRWANEVGLSLEVSTSDLGWANQAMSTLSAEIDKGRPRWHAMHRSTGMGSLGLLVAVIIGGATLLALLPHLSKPAEVVGIAFTCLLFGMCFMLAVTNPRFYYSLFPPIELLGEDNPSTTGRRIAFTASLIMSVAIGVFVNLIS